MLALSPSHQGHEAVTYKLPFQICEGEGIEAPGVLVEAELCRQL